MDIEKAKLILLYLYVFPFCFWAFDVITTVYAINYLAVASELNPLGWPWGAWGALAFYVPALIFVYLLLFRVHSNYSFWAAVLITCLALAFGVMNLLAGIHNVQIIQLYSGRNLLLSRVELIQMGIMFHKTPNEYWKLK